MPLQPCQPIVKWVGGKRQLLNELTSRLPEHYNTYFEPFFGGGALFFYHQSAHAVLSDVNSQLVNLYSQIKANSEAVTELLDAYQNSYNILTTDAARTDYYKQQRSVFNQCISSNEFSPRSAALFIFLNKTCFNGLYRCNSKGQFNSPPNHKEQVNLYDRQNITNVSQCLAKATILNVDFEEACKTATEGDFVFFDSPYYDTFDTYQSGGFTEQDHVRLATLFNRLTEQNVYCVLTNSNSDFIKDLYSEHRIEVVDVKRMVNRDANGRTGQEVIIRNY